MKYLALFASGVILVVAVLLLMGCPQQYTLTVNVTGQGTVALNPPGGAYNAATSVALTANPASNWHFEEWQGDVTGSANPATITMSGNKTVTAVFAENGSHGDSVRFLTFNVAMIPETWEDVCCTMGNDERAAIIAGLIKAGDYDIVVLNEVFDEDSRDEFEAQLSGNFPSYVKKIDYFWNMEDSGLMLFSRFPFEPLLHGDYKYGNLEAYNQGAEWEDVAATVFPAYTCTNLHHDCDAAKGVGFVRIRNPVTNHILNVAFSHMQASYGDGDCTDEADGRKWQFHEMWNVLVGTMGDKMYQEDVFLLGDLNIDGDQGNMAEPHDHNWGYDTGNPCDSDNLWEWVTRFATPTAWTTSWLKDSWVYEQSPYDAQAPFDRGLTAGLPVPGERLDYVLRNRAQTAGSAQRYKMQHLTREHGLRVGQGHILSDHIAVCADYNVAAQYCNPLEACKPPMDKFVNGNIQYPGSMQWYRIDEPGGYLFAVVGDDMAYSVYESKDLTTPATQYFEETGEIHIAGLVPQTVVGQKYILPEAPFYIRCFKTARNLTGTYQLIVHRLTGASKEEAIPLLPAAPYEEYTMPEGIPVGPQDTVWFELHIEAADSGAAQHTSFKVLGIGPLENILRLALEKDDGTIVAEDVVAEHDPWWPYQNCLLIERDNLGTQPEVVYMKVKRMSLDPVDFQAGWNTNLTIVHGAVVSGAVQEILHCVVETDAGIQDRDEIYITVAVDGVVVVNDLYIGQYDDDYNEDLEGILWSRRFVSSVQVTLRESEEGEPYYGNDDYFYFTIDPMIPYWQPRVREALGLSLSAVDEDAAGEYSISYNLSRTLQQKQ